MDSQRGLNYIAQETLLNVMWQPGWEGGYVAPGWEPCTRMAESLHCSPETIITLLIGHQFSSVAQSCPTHCDPMNRSTPGLPVHHQLPEFTQTHNHWVGDAIQPSHPLSSPSPPAPNPSQHQAILQYKIKSSKCRGKKEFLCSNSPGNKPKMAIQNNKLEDTQCHLPGIYEAGISRFPKIVW